MNKIASSISKLVDRKTGSLPTQAIVVRVDQIQADLSFGVGTGVVHNAPIQGDPNLLKVGGVVAVQWVTQGGGYLYPVVIASAGGVPSAGMTINMTVEPDNQTIENRSGYLSVKDYGIGLDKLSFSPSLEGHTHPGLLAGSGFSAGGGVLYSDNGLLRLDGVGRIVVGDAAQSVIIDTVDPTYRLWAGSLYGIDAPFSVDKDGSIRSTAGAIGGWNIEADQLDADNGMIILNSDVPFIGLGGADAYREDGIWLGKDSDDIYKVFIGNENNYLSWDGDDLAINGEITAVSGAIGGWTIAAGELSSSSIVLNSLGEYISIGGPDGYLSDPGFWVGMDGVAKMHIGDPDADFMSWDGNTLTVSGALFSAENIIGVIGGSMMITKDRGTFSVAVTSSQTTIDFGRTMTDGDFVLIKARNSAGVVATEYMEIGSLVSGFTYNVTRGLNGAGQDWPVNTIFVVLGQHANDDGFIELDAFGSPEIAVVRQLATYGETEKIVSLSAESGIAIGVRDFYTDDRAYTFTYNGDVIGGLYGLMAEETSFSFITKPVMQQPMSLNFISEALADEPSRIYLRAENEYYSTEVRIGTLEGLSCNTFIRADNEWHSANVGDIIAGSDMVAMRSLHVGTNARTSSEGSIRATGNMQIGSTTSINPSTVGQIAAKYLALDNLVELKAQSSAPSSPSSNWGRMYANTNSFPHWKDSAGTVSDILADVISLNIHGFYYYGGAGTVTSWYTQTRSIPNSGTPSFAFTASLPYSWKNKSIYLDLFVGTSTTSSAYVVWEFVGRVLKNGQNPAGYAAISNNATYSLPGSGDRIIVHSLPITVDWGYGHDSRIINLAMEVWRDTVHASDTFPAALLLFGAQLRATS